MKPVRVQRSRQREIADGDVIVFATGDDQQEPSRRSFPDIMETDER